VIAIRGREENKSFTVRRIAAGSVGVERIWPLSSPWIQQIEVAKTGKVRRSKLYYLRERVGKRAIKVKTKLEKPGSRKSKSKSKTAAASSKKASIKKQDEKKSKSQPKSGPR
jgi:hypothetical protein